MDLISLKDSPVLACAVHPEIDALVTSDRELHIPSTASISTLLSLKPRVKKMYYTYSISNVGLISFSSSNQMAF